MNFSFSIENKKFILAKSIFPSIVACVKCAKSMNHQAKLVHVPLSRHIQKVVGVYAMCKRNFIALCQKSRLENDKNSNTERCSIHL